MTQPCDLLITAAQIVTLDGRLGIVDDGAVAVRGEQIADLGDRRTLTGRWQPARRLDAPGQILLPGFVDTHVHLAAFLFVDRPYEPSTGPSAFSGGGRAETVLPMVARFTSAQIDPELTYAAVRPALAAMLRAGYTGFVDAGGFGVEGVAQAAVELGIRAAAGPSLADLWHDESGVLRRQADADRLLGRAEAYAGGHDDLDGGRVRALVSAVETGACSDELLAGIARLGRDRGIPTHVHTNIVAHSDAEHRAEFGGRSETDRLGEAGMLTPGCTLMHVGVMSDADVAAVAASGAAANHNPLGNALLGFGVATGRAAPRLLAAGVPVALGSDTAPQLIPSPFDLMRTALALHRDAARDDSALTLEQALAMATGGAAALGRRGRLGRIAAGQLADLVLLDPSGIHHLPSAHPVPAVVLNGQHGDVTTVVVAGRPVVEHGQLVRADERDLLDAARKAREAIAA
jgi:cytosine/adenosine deaminase-related metal-dependent hydrolase